MSKSIGVISGVLFSLLPFGGVAMGQSVTAIGVAGQPYDRTAYYNRAPRRPFTFVSRYTLSHESLDHEIRIEAVEAEGSNQKVLYDNQTFNPGSDGSPMVESIHVVDRATATLTAIYWSKWQHALGKPVLFTTGNSPGMVREQPMPENNCVSPEPALKFLRHEAIRIGGQDYPAAVVQAADMLIWYSMSPGLGCLELKSVATYVSPDEGDKKGTTIHEPVSLTLGEPNPQIFDVQAKFAGEQIEVIPFESWERTITTRTKEYKQSAK